MASRHTTSREGGISKAGRAHNNKLTLTKYFKAGILDIKEQNKRPRLDFIIQPGLRIAGIGICPVQECVGGLHFQSAPPKVTKSTLKHTNTVTGTDTFQVDPKEDFTFGN